MRCAFARALILSEFVSKISIPRVASRFLELSLRSSVSMIRQEQRDGVLVWTYTARKQFAYTVQICQLRVLEGASPERTFGSDDTETDVNEVFRKGGSLTQHFELERETGTVDILQERAITHWKGCMGAVSF